MKSLQNIIEKRQKFIDAIKANQGAIDMELFGDIYPDKAHFIYELLQNAEDQSATSVQFVLSNDNLIFEHDGKPFDCDDVDSITGINHSAKSDKPDKIGRFGVGFKAVFSYTETPRIWSPSYAFEISEMVLPSELDLDPGLGSRTRFEFPFNSAKKPQNHAFSEIQDGLEDISDKTLLFLTYIEEIQWRVEGGREGRLLRILNSDHCLEILREIDGKPTKSSHFLRYSEAAGGLERQHIAIAFELEPRSGEQRPDTRGPFAKQFRIVPAEPGCVAVYFTAAKETSNLRFHLHAPFVPELSRSSIKDTPANEPLFRQLAGLTARSLCEIRDLGLLDRDFLGVLPNSHDNLPDRYSVIREAIVDAMKEQPLTPTHAGRHAPACRLLGARAPARLKDLLGREDIDFLTDRDQRDWAVTAPRRNNEVDRFLRDLDIEEWEIEHFVKTLGERLCSSTYTWKQDPDPRFLCWIRQKALDWHRALYALFAEELKNFDRFRQICIVRCSDGAYRTGSECYFPTPETREDSIHPRVVEGTYAGGGTEVERTNARKFLEDIGVREVGKHEEVEGILKRRYVNPDNSLSWETHEADLKRFIELVEKEKDRRAADLFKSYRIFQGNGGDWFRPNKIYLDKPYLDTGLRFYYGHPNASGHACVSLSENYLNLDDDSRNHLAKFARTCGVHYYLELAKINCHNNPEKKYLFSASGKWRYDTSQNKDFVIRELDKLFQSPDQGLSWLVWKTLSKEPDNTKILKAICIYSPPPTDDESFFLTGSDPAWFRAPFPRSRPRTGCTGFG